MQTPLIFNIPHMYITLAVTVLQQVWGKDAKSSIGYFGDYRERCVCMCVS